METHLDYKVEEKTAQELCDIFNKNPEGARFRYSAHVSFIDDFNHNSWRHVCTIGQAFVTQNGHPVVHVDECEVYVLITHLRTD